MIIKYYVYAEKLYLMIYFIYVGKIWLSDLIKKRMFTTD